MFWFVIGSFAGIYFFIKGFAWLKQKKLIEDTPTSKIRSIAMGVVEIYGKVLPLKTLKSPFSDKECAYYRYTIEEYKSRGKSSSWVTLKKEDKMVPFYIKDETGKVLIEPAAAEIDIPYDNQYDSGVGRDPPDNVAKFLKANGMDFENFFGFNKKMRYTEYMIEPSDKLYVFGTATTKDSLKIAYESGSFGKTETGLNNEDSIMIYKGKNIYYISDKPEKDILTSFKWKVIGGLFGGAALIIICLSVIFLELGLLL